MVIDQQAPRAHVSDPTLPIRLPLYRLILSWVADMTSDKHSQFATTFPIYIKERKMVKREAQTPLTEDDDELNDDLDTKEQSPVDDEFTTEESWVHVNDKAPIWMRCVHVTS